MRKPGKHLPLELCHLRLKRLRLCLRVVQLDVTPSSRLDMLSRHVAGIVG